MINYISYDQILNTVEGEFENYYKKIVSRLLFDIDRIDIEDDLFKDVSSRQTIVNGLVRGVIEKVAKISIFSLIDYYRSLNLSYSVFNKLLLDDDFIKEFHSIYPMLPPKIEQTVKNYLSRFAEIFSTISQYKFKIENFVGTTEKLTDISVFEGDFHKDTFVVILTLGKTKVVLKKRNNLGEQCLNIFLKYFERESESLPVVRTKILSNTICLQDFISDNQMLSSREVRNYYYKFGSMAFIFALLGTKDLHNENVIATKNGPYFIDLEVAITAINDPKSYSFIKESHLFNSNEDRMVYGNTDLSAFSGDVIFMNDISVVNKGKDDINLGVISKKVKRQNIPKDNSGNKFRPKQYKLEVLLGFQEGLRIFKKYRQEIILDLEKIENFEYRLVIRNTGFYSKYLADLVLPVYTKSLNKTEDYLHLLNKSTQSEAIIKEEIDCLTKNIIPYFTTKSFLDNNKIKSEFLNRVKNFDDVIASKEEFYLKLILNIELKPIFFDNTQTSLERIDKELKQFINFSSNEVCFSYGTVDDSISNQLKNYKNDIYTFGGTLLFLNNFYKSESILKKIEFSISSNKSYRHISGLTGYQAELFLKYLLGIKFDRRQYLAIDNLIHNDDVIDFSTYGSAIVVLSILFEESLHEDYLLDLQKLGKLYIHHLEKQNLTGLFHGMAGDCLVLNILYKYFDKKLITDLILRNLRKENSEYLSEEYNWRDKRDESLGNDNLFAISYGAPGIIFSRLALYLNTDLPLTVRTIAYQDIINGAIGILHRCRSDYPDDTLINGYTGSLLVLKIIKHLNIFDDSCKLFKEIDEYLSQAKMDLTANNWKFQSNNIGNFNFFNGRIGTAFVLSVLSDDNAKFNIVSKILGV